MAEAAVVIHTRIKNRFRESMTFKYRLFSEVELFSTESQYYALYYV